MNATDTDLPKHSKQTTETYDYQGDEVMNLEEIRELVMLLEQSSLTELAVETDDLKISLRKAPAQEQSGKLDKIAAIGDQALTVTIPGEIREAGLVSVSSPMVGTFYEAPSPDSEPFAKVGDMVSKGQTLCIVEAMKLMNEIKSEYDGTVMEVAAENGQAVEYNQVLFWIKES